jgi:hypothetical protein
VVDLIDRVLGVLKNDNVSFAELSRLDGFSGDRAILLEDDKMSNIVLWPSISAEAADVVRAIIAEGEYEVKPTVVMTYVIDGVVPQMPLVKRARHYKEPHWLPCVFRRKMVLGK